MILDILGMQDMGFFLLCALILGISIAIWYNVIRSATKSSTIQELNRMQIKLLKEIALKNGVAPETVDSIIVKEYME